MNPPFKTDLPSTAFVPITIEELAHITISFNPHHNPVRLELLLSPLANEKTNSETSGYLSEISQLGEAKTETQTSDSSCLNDNNTNNKNCYNLVHV